MIIDKQIWKELTAGIRNRSGLAVRRIDLKSGLDFYASMVSPEGFPAVLIEADHGDLPKKIERSCIGFHLRLIRRGSKDGSVPSQVLLQLADSDYQDVFYILAEDLAARMNKAKNKHTAIMVFFNLLARWARFFEKHGKSGLDRHEQQGLYGELWTMKYVLSPILGVEKTVLAWVGPEEANQDFSIDNFICEIKTSVSPPHEKFKVSNILQLDTASDSVFVLVFMALETKQSNLGTLPQLVEVVKQEVAESCPSIMETFLAKLIQYGYMDSQKKLYQERGYSVIHSHFYHVRDDFPRLLVNKLPTGVGEVQYSVAIASCLEYTLDMAELTELINGGVSQND